MSRSAFVVVIRIVGIVSALVGLLHVSIGPEADVLLGAELPTEVAGDPVLNSQNRFYGAVFMCYGALMYLSASDPRGLATVFRVLCAFMFVGGLARLIPIAGGAWPPAPVLFLLSTELLGPPLLVSWHQRVLTDTE